MILKTNEVVAEILRNSKGSRPKVVLATGTFDLFHYEHLNYLEGAKKQGDILVVGVKDNIAAGLKADGRPIIDEIQRVQIIDALKCVDYTILAEYDWQSEVLEFKADNKKQEEWLRSFQKLFKILKPDVMYHEDNPVLQSARERVFRRYGIKGVMKPRGEGASTTEIIAKIKRTIK